MLLITKEMACRTRQVYQHLDVGPMHLWSLVTDFVDLGDGTCRCNTVLPYIPGCFCLGKYVRICDETRIIEGGEKSR